MEIKAAQISGFLKSPTAGLRVILVYGPDRGMVAERTRALVKHYAGSLDDAFNISRMNGSDVTGDNSPLFDEYFSIPMFGGQKTLWIFDDATQIQKQIKSLLEEPKEGNIVIIEGRDLKKTSALVKLCIKSKKAASLPCYQDNLRDVSQLIRDMLVEHKLTISSNNLQYLQSLLGNDRALTRSEIDKLITYCLKQDEVTEADITACLTGDAAKFSFDKLLDAICAGQTQAADHELTHFISSGDHPVMIFAIIRNHFNMLHAASYGLSKGKSPDSIVSSMRPPVFFNRKNAIISQVNRWNMRKTDLAQTLIAQADIDARMNAQLSKDILNRLVTRLSLMAGR
ncbi:MAG: DNA polymerase III subunit delta [Hyphomicrobiales bacterium]